jgi:hypothetical protein
MHRDRYNSLPTDIFQRAHQREVDKVLHGQNPLDPYDDIDKKKPLGKRKTG